MCRRAPSPIAYRFRNQKPNPLLRTRPNLCPSRIAASRSASVVPAVEHPVIRIDSGRIPRALGIIWAFLSLLMLARLGFGFRKLQGLKADALPLPREWQLRLTRLSRINGVRRKTQLLVSTRIAAPMSLGFLHPAILIPQDLLDTLSNSELEHVVLHELAHLRRRDDWTNLAQKFIEAILPIQPALYWIGHRMSIEREMACDDWVIATTGTAKPYAASLTKVAELTQWRRADILAAGATGNRSQLFSRIHHMLNGTRNAAPKLALAPLAAAIAAAATLICIGVRAPQLIAFAQTSAYENTRQQPSHQPRRRRPTPPMRSTSAIGLTGAAGADRVAGSRAVAPLPAGSLRTPGAHRAPGSLTRPSRPQPRSRAARLIWR